jgi:hypothetical protein
MENRLVIGREGQRCVYLWGRRSWRGMRRLSGGVVGARRGRVEGEGVVARPGAVTVGCAGPRGGGVGRVEGAQFGGGVVEPQPGG